MRFQVMSKRMECNNGVLRTYSQVPSLERNRNAYSCICLDLTSLTTDAYDETLGQLHSWVVRTGIKAGTLGLPSRDAFFQSIGETPESAREHANGFTIAADAIVAAVERLYDGVEMPQSDFSVKSLWS